MHWTNDAEQVIKSFSSSGLHFGLSIFLATTFGFPFSMTICFQLYYIPFKQVGLCYQRENSIEVLKFSNSNQYQERYHLDVLGLLSIQASLKIEYVFVQFFLTPNNSQPAQCLYSEPQRSYRSSSNLLPPQIIY